MGTLKVVVIAGPEFTRVANALREIDVQMVSKFRTAMRKAAEPIIKDVQLAAMRLPAHKLKHTGLRARVAKGVGVRAGLGTQASMRFTTSMNEPDEWYLPRGLDLSEKGWRHPVYGNMDIWVHQRGGSWFRETIADNRELLQDRLTDVLEDAAHTVAVAGAGP